MALSRAASVANVSLSPSSSTWVAMGKPSATIAKSSMTLLSIASSSLSNSCRCSLMPQSIGRPGEAGSTSRGRTGNGLPRAAREAVPVLSSDQQLDPGDLADVRGHLLLNADRTRSEDAQRPLARLGEEPERAVLAERHLGDELVAGAEQPGVAARHRGATAEHLALDDRLLARLVLRDGHSACRRAAAVVAHLPSPSSIGTPTSEPYSVHEPS